MSATSPGQAIQQRHFLVVEDDDHHAAIILRTLQRNRGVASVYRVGDGEQALAYLRGEGDYAGEFRPDVILLDLRLPKLDGCDVLAQIKQDPQLRMIPAIVLSTSSAAQDRAEAYRCGANSYLVKTRDPEAFRQLLDDMILYWSKWNRPAPQVEG